jgi:hypothetical protein
VLEQPYQVCRLEPDAKEVRQKGETDDGARPGTSVSATLHLTDTFPYVTTGHHAALLSFGRLAGSSI